MKHNNDNKTQQGNSANISVEKGKLVKKDKITIAGFYKHFRFGIYSSVIVAFEWMLLTGAICIYGFINTGNLTPPSNPNFLLGMVISCLWIFIGGFFPGFLMADNDESENYGCLPLIIVSVLCALLFALIATVVLKLLSLNDEGWLMDAVGIGLGLIGGGFSWIFLSPKFDKK